MTVVYGSYAYILCPQRAQEKNGKSKSTLSVKMLGKTPSVDEGLLIESSRTGTEWNLKS